MTTETPKRKRSRNKKTAVAEAPDEAVEAPDGNGQAEAAEEVAPLFKLDYDPKAHPFKTVSGITLTLRAITMLDIGRVSNAIRSKHVRQGKAIDPPVIKMPLAGGGVQESMVTSKMVVTFKKQLADKSFTSKTIRAEVQRVVEQWEQHLTDTDEMNGEINRETTKVLLRGVTDDLPADHEWLLERLYIGIEDIPGFETWFEDHPDEADLNLKQVTKRVGSLTRTQRFDLWFYWLATVVCVLPSELVRLQTEVMYISGEGSVSREVIAASGEMFLGAIYQEMEQRQTNAAAQASSDSAPETSVSGSSQQNEKAGQVAAQ